MRNCCLTTSISLLLLTFTPDRAISQTLTTFDVPGARQTVALGINDRSEVVGYFSDANGRDHGFLRARGEFTVIDFPESTGTQAYGINNFGQIVGIYFGKGVRAFLVDRGQFIDIGHPDALSTHAHGINDLGQVVGVYNDSHATVRGFLWSHGQFVTLNFPSSAPAHGINASGQVTAQHVDPVESYGLRIEPRGDVAVIRVPLATLTLPTGINSGGEIVGNFIRPSSGGPPKTQGFLFAFGTFTTIDVPGSGGTIARGINNRRQIVGAYIDAGIGIETHGFILTPPNVIEDISGAPSPDGARVPIASVIVDGDLTLWSLGPGQEILHDGQQAGGGYGSQILWSRGNVYVLGDDSNWWQWSAGIWVLFGPNDPSR
jgi:probable HAF family extracellular repeat protein